MEQIPSWEADRQKWSASYWTQCSLPCSQEPPLDGILSQMIPIHTLASCLFKISFIIFPSNPTSLMKSVSFRLSDYIFYALALLGL
jgi:hypothetical protein